MLLGEEIKKARRYKGFTLKELGEIVGVTHSALSRIENGKNAVSRKVLIALARALGDNFGLEWLNEHLLHIEQPVSKRELAKAMSVEELVSLKFPGAGETRTRTQMRALAQLLDAEIEKEERILGYPEYKKKK